MQILNQENEFMYQQKLKGRVSWSINFRSHEKTAIKLKKRKYFEAKLIIVLGWVVIIMHALVKSRLHHYFN